MVTLQATAINSPFGQVLVAAGANGLRQIALTSHPDRFETALLESSGNGRPAAVQWVSSPQGALAEAVRQLTAYFAGEQKAFSVPMDLAGRSQFETRILSLVATIPWGTVMSYGEVATMAGAHGAARAVGGVMGRNPIPIVVPCHRVVASGGGLGGFGGGLDLKRALLAHEGLTCW